MRGTGHSFGSETRQDEQAYLQAIQQATMESEKCDQSVMGMKKGLRRAEQPP